MNCECMNNLKLKIKKGESLGFAFTLSQNNNPINMTGGSIIFQVRDDVADNGFYVINKTITEDTSLATIGKITSAENGTFVIKITDSDIANLSTLKPYFCAIYYENNGDSRCISANSGQCAQLIVLNP